MKPAEHDLAPYLEHLRDLPFVRRIEIVDDGVVADGQPLRLDAAVRIWTPRGRHRLLVEVKRTHLTETLVHGIIAQTTQIKSDQWILFAPYVGRPMAQHLAANDVNYVDLAGNLRLRIGKEHMAVIQGRRSERSGPRGRGVGKAGYQVLITILARPELLNEPVRILARAAGVSKSTVASTMKRLIDEGLVGQGADQRRLLEWQQILDRWLTGYATTVRPKLLVGTFRTPDEDPETLEKQIETALGDTAPWAYGGAAAAMKLTGFYRGFKTVVHIGEWRRENAARLRAVRAAEGPLIVLGIPGEAAFRGAVPRTVHPLLVYTELLAEGHPRARDAAERIYAQYLKT
ncbi:MAG: hypothetical protein GF355_11855 [Candidatus Eisenbacteria bacterium]|nr:hypothetical protein [Candidatus Eisenbacteria bacterium]